MTAVRVHVGSYFAGENRAAVELAGQIRQQMAHGELRPGDRLLSERRLSQRLRVPLHAVRVALHQLKREGLVRSRSKSGVYVTQAAGQLTTSSSRSTTAVASEPASTTSTSTVSIAPLADASLVSSGLDGFHLLDAPRQVEHDLRVLVTNWNRRTRPLWERLCRDYSRRRPHVRIRPIFPPRVIEYEKLRASCDVFFSCHQSLLNEPVERLNLASFDRAELEAVGIDSRYIAAVETAPNETFGVPVSACLLQGFINTHQVSAKAARQLEGVESWEEALALLSALARAQPKAHPLNFCPFHTFNLSQFLTLAAGGLLDERGELDMHRPALRQAIEVAERYLDGSGAREGLGQSAYPQRPCLSLIEYSYRAGLHCASAEGWKPWLYPLGPRGRAMEAVNFGVVNRHSLHIDEARRFLLHLASPEAQELFATVPGEHPISRFAGDPFQAYSESCRRIFHQVRERAEVLREFVPGYFVAMNALRLAGKQWFHGHMSADDVCVTVERERSEHLARHAPSPTAVTTAPGGAIAMQPST